MKIVDNIRFQDGPVLTLVLLLGYISITAYTDPMPTLCIRFSLL